MVMNQMTKRQAPVAFRARVRDFFKFVSLREVLRGPVPNRQLVLCYLHGLRKEHVLTRKRVMAIYRDMKQDMSLKEQESYLKKPGTSWEETPDYFSEHHEYALECRKERRVAAKWRDAGESLMHLEGEMRARKAAISLLIGLRNELFNESVLRTRLAVMYLQLEVPSRLKATPEVIELTYNIFSISEKEGAACATTQLETVAFLLQLLETDGDVQKKVCNLLRLVAYCKQDAEEVTRCAEDIIDHLGGYAINIFSRRPSTGDIAKFGRSSNPECRQKANVIPSYLKIDSFVVY
jgi:hypothetical protein